MRTRRATSHASCDGGISERSEEEEEDVEDNRNEEEDASDSVGVDSDDSDFSIIPDPNERLKVGLKVPFSI